MSRRRLRAQPELEGCVRIRGEIVPLWREYRWNDGSVSRIWLAPDALRGLEAEFVVELRRPSSGTTPNAPSHPGNRRIRARSPE